MNKLEAIKILINDLSDEDKKNIAESISEKKEQYKIGDWVESRNLRFRITKFNGDEVYGDNGRSKVDANKFYFEDNFKCTQSVLIRLLTAEEIKEHLSVIADKKGYKLGTTSVSLVYSAKTDELWKGICLLYKQGKWAEIVQEQPEERKTNKFYTEGEVENMLYELLDISNNENTKNTKYMKQFMVNYILNKK